MTLKENKGNTYQFVTHTWNPFKGKCFNNCSFCTIRSVMDYPDSVILDRCELFNSVPFNEGKFILISDSFDIFAREVPSELIKEVFDFCVEATSHQPQYHKTLFLIQTKNPARMEEFICHPLVMDQQIGVCTIIETNRHYPEIMNNAPTPRNRAEALSKLAEHGINTYIAIEPLMDFDLDEFILLLEESKPTQVFIGDDSEYDKTFLPTPSIENTAELISQLRKFTRVEINQYNTFLANMVKPTRRNFYKIGEYLYTLGNNMCLQAISQEKIFEGKRWEEFRLACSGFLKTFKTLSSDLAKWKEELTIEETKSKEPYLMNRFDYPIYNQYLNSKTTIFFKNQSDIQQLHSFIYNLIHYSVFPEESESNQIFTFNEVLWKLEWQLGKLSDMFPAPIL